MSIRPCQFLRGRASPTLCWQPGLVSGWAFVPLHHFVHCKNYASFHFGKDITELHTESKQKSRIPGSYESKVQDSRDIAVRERCLVLPAPADRMLVWPLASREMAFSVWWGMATPIPPPGDIYPHVYYIPRSSKIEMKMYQNAWCSKAF